MLEYVKGQGWVETPTKEVIFVCGTRTRVVNRKPNPGEAWDFYKEYFPYEHTRYRHFVTDHLIEGCLNGTNAHRIRVFEKVVP